MDFEDVYMNLGITKEEKTMMGEDKESLSDYKELFAENPESSAAGRKRRRKKLRKKILIKGDPGIGKSTLAAKMAYDWAVSTWKMFSLVFFISMRVVNPGDPIGNIIIDENIVPSVYAKNYPIDKILNILEERGEKCLLIFDDLDGPVSNEMVLRVVKDLTLTNCHILLTARPNAVAGIEAYFSTVCNVEGFSEEDACEYVKKLLTDTGKVEAVINFTKKNQSIGIHEMWRYPILLLFICILVNDGNLDLQSKTITLTNIYDRLLLCLFRRYTVKWNVKQDPRKRREILLKLGKVALEGLEKGKLFYSKSEIEEKVGKEAFHYGIIIGYKDRRIVEDIDADFLVCFLHHTICEYLAACYISDHLARTNRCPEDIWPRVWDSETIAKLPLLLIFALDVSMGEPVAREKLFKSMVKTFNQPILELQGNLMGVGILDFLFRVLDKCDQIKVLTFLNTRLCDDHETIVKLMEHKPFSLEKLVFNKCVFFTVEETFQSRKPYLKQNTRFEVQCLDCDIPVTSLKFLASHKCIHTLLLKIDHIMLSQDLQKVSRFHESFIDLLLYPLTMIQHLKICGEHREYGQMNETVRLHKESFESIVNTHNPSNNIALPAFVGNLADLESLDISCAYIPDAMLCVLIASIGDRAHLHSIRIYGGVGSTVQQEMTFTERLLSKVSPVLQDLEWNNGRIKDNLLPFRDIFGEIGMKIQYKTMTEGFAKEIEKHSHQENIKIAKDCFNALERIDFSDNTVIYPCDRSRFLQALNGQGSIKELKLSNLWLPHFMPLLQGAGMPALEILVFKFQFDLPEEQDFELPKENQADVCTLPKLTQLDLPCERRTKQIHQNLLKQFCISVRGSFYLTSVDLSGQNAGGCLYCLVNPEGLPSLIELRADDCGLLPVDMFRLGRAAKVGTLTKVKGLSLIDNPKIANHLCYLCIGSWSSLIGIRVSTLSSWDVTCLVHSSRTIMPHLEAIICSATSKQLFGSYSGVLREKRLGVRAYDELDSIDLGMLDMFKKLFSPDNRPNYREGEKKDDKGCPLQ